MRFIQILMTVSGHKNAPDPSPPAAVAAAVASHGVRRRWSHRQEKNDEGERFVAVLEVPPVVSAETAVRVQIVKDSKKGKT